jgi:hypothetical protein
LIPSNLNPIEYFKEVENNDPNNEFFERLKKFDKYLNLAVFIVPSKIHVYNYGVSDHVAVTHSQGRRICRQALLRTTTPLAEALHVIADDVLAGKSPNDLKCVG